MEKDIQNSDGFDSEDMTIITITDQSGNKVECSVVTVFEHNHRDYIALIPEEADEQGNYNILLFRYRILENSGDEGIVIENISADMEFDEVLHKFNQIMEEEGCIAS